MKELLINPEQPTQAQLDFVSDYLAQPGLAILATDTVPGYSTLVTASVQIDRIYHYKNRPKTSYLIVLVSSLEMAQEYANLNPSLVNLVTQIWQEAGPTTIILPANQKKTCDYRCYNPAGQIALRLPKSKFLIKLIEKLGLALVSTSINNHGKTAQIDAKAYLTDNNLISEDILVVESINQVNGKPSRIIDLSSGKRFIVRP